jgi:hypothetical protein
LGVWQPAASSSFYTTRSFWVNITYNKSIAGSANCLIGLKEGFDTDGQASDQAVTNIGTACGSPSSNFYIVNMDVSACTGPDTCVNNGDGRVSIIEATHTWQNQIVRWNVSVCAGASHTNYDIDDLWWSCTAGKATLNDFVWGISILDIPEFNSMLLPMTFISLLCMAQLRKR